MAEQFVITNASVQDVDAIIAMHAQSWRDTYPNQAAGVSKEWVLDRVAKWRSPEKRAQRLEKIKQSTYDPDIIYKVIKDKEGATVGLAMASRDTIAQRIDALYVDKQYHGKGVAQRLMNEIISWLDSSRQVELEVAAYNERAKAFYKKYGFIEVEGSQRMYDVIPVVQMIHKSLAEEVIK